MLRHNNLSIESPKAYSLKTMDSGITKKTTYGEWELDLINQTLLWSKNQYAIYGYKPSELSLNPDFFIYKTTHFSEIERITKIIDDAKKSQSEYSFSRKIIKNGGKLGFAETNATIIRSKTGHIVKIKGITIDVGGYQSKGHLNYNDPVFFNTLYVKYKKAITFEIYKMTFDHALAEDLSQETFLKAWKNISQYNAEKGQLYTWIINIARNNCRDYFRSKYHRVQKDAIRLDLPSNQKLKCLPSNVDNFEIKGLVSKLPNDLGEIIEMLFIEGYTQEELASTKRIPLGTVKTKSRKAIGLLRETFAYSKC